MYVKNWKRYVGYIYIYCTIQYIYYIIETNTSPAHLRSHNLKLSGQILGEISVTFRPFFGRIPQSWKKHFAGFSVGDSWRKIVGGFNPERYARQKWKWRCLKTARGLEQEMINKSLKKKTTLHQTGICDCNHENRHKTWRMVYSHGQQIEGDDCGYAKDREMWTL